VVVRERARIPRVHDILGLISLETVGEAMIEHSRPFVAQPSRNPFPLLYRQGVRPIQFWRTRRNRSGQSR
jgi:hypothetical protein